MDLKGILSISGYPGLFKMVAQTKNGIIVESLIDKKRMQAFATSKISALEDIAIYTLAGETPLADVFRSIFDKAEGKETITSKASGADLKGMFSEVLPDYDSDRFYVSDMKRVVTWYNLLLDQDLMEFSDDDSTEDDKTEESEKVETEK